tara:strand:+ start:4080 stop:4292 length:213 start_codon:yes stop_codon:yes gene_type:complete
VKLEIKVVINGEEKILESEMSISDFLKIFDYETDRVAVEKNLEIIPLSDHKNEMIKEGDRIEIVGFIGGG